MTSNTVLQVIANLLELAVQGMLWSALFVSAGLLPFESFNAVPFLLMAAIVLSGLERIIRLNIKPTPLPYTESEDA